ncbi:MAG: hypothetical protein RL036_19 [Actinomycetota bacterium]|jgi:hypothetical protein
MSQMSNFPLHFLEAIMRLRVIDAPEVNFAEYISGAAHAFQLDKAGKPYAGHPRRVATNVKSHPNFEALSQSEKSTVVSAAWLHDVVEDSGTNGFPRIGFGFLFGKRIEPESLRVIELLTRPEDTSPQAQDAYCQAISANPLAKMVKLADIADNLNEQRLALLPKETQDKAREKYAHALDALEATTSERAWLAERVAIEPDFDSQHCPICQRWVTSSMRYPKYVCYWCTLHITDENGKTISISNAELLGYGVMVNGVEVESGYPVVVQGVRCTASEAYFGGIVIEPAGTDEKLG